jgi:hypothetical protein
MTETGLVPLRIDSATSLARGQNTEVFARQVTKKNHAALDPDAGVTAFATAPAQSLVFEPGLKGWGDPGGGFQRLAQKV